MSDVRLEAVRKSFGAVNVIKGADLEICAGEFMVFVGPSGCGKSTLLRMIAGLEEITSGTLQIGGAVVNDVDPAKRGIAMVFQSYALYPHMTVRQNMGFALRFAGVSKADVERQVSEAARILELEPLLDRKPRELSGGQRQRVAIGRAIVRHPKVFLFDEPLSNLDAELRVHMRIEIGRLHKKLNATIIYVTHDQVEAMTLADRIVVLRAGEIEQVGTPLELYDDPDNLFVAGFIGSPRINLLHGVIEEAGPAGATVRLPDHDGSLVSLSHVSAAPASGTPVTLGIRPEHLGGDGAARLDLTIELVEHLGAETFAYAKRGDGEVLTVAMPSRRDIAAGQTLTARFDPAAAFLFDVDGRRIR